MTKLNEKQEKCSYCHHLSTTLIKGEIVSDLVGDYNEVSLDRGRNGKYYLHSEASLNYGNSIGNININFCPMCGRRLDDEPKRDD